MNNKKFTPKKPKYKGHLQVSAWENINKEGKVYLSIKLDTNFKLFLIEE